MRRSGAILAQTITRVVEAVGPGVSTLDLDRIAATMIAEAGARGGFAGYRGGGGRAGAAAWFLGCGGGGGRIAFPATICASINDEIVHGIPSADRVLGDGDLVSLDFGAIWEGFHSDSAVAVFVGAPPDDDAKRLVEVTEAALDAAIAVVRPGGRLSDIGHAIEQTAERHGLGIVREYGGHGIGRAMHEDPFIPNWGSAGRGPALTAGLVVAIEPMLTLGADATRIMADAWTVRT